MNIIPAIDLIGGKAVRLQKGDYAKVTVYSDRPEEVAKEFYSAGARFLHVVDLDGAKSGKADNIETIKKIVEATDLSVEVGGGIRSMETVDLYIPVRFVETASSPEMRGKPNVRTLPTSRRQKRDVVVSLCSTICSCKHPWLSFKATLNRRKNFPSLGRALIATGSIPRICSNKSLLWPPATP